MKEFDYAPWVDGVHRKLNNFRLLFVQVGASNAPARRALLGSVDDVQDMFEFFKHEECYESRTVLIDDVESLTGQDKSFSIGRLRSSVLNCIDRGCKIILLSRAPRVAFPAVVGSSLFDDASFVHAPSRKFSTVGDWPACAEDGEPPETLLRCVLAEIGSEVCASLDRSVYEGQLTGNEALQGLTTRELEAIDAAGLTTSLEGLRCWNFPWHLNPLKGALEAMLSDSVDAQPQLASVTQSMWKIERMIRRQVRLKSIETWGNTWRKQCLNEDLKNKVLDRATGSAYPSATAISELRDPLEWLSLGELLTLTDTNNIGKLGIEEALWRKFRSEVLPIRNRLAHMRFLYPEDEINIIRWRRVFEKRFQNI